MKDSDFGSFPTHCQRCGRVVMRKSKKPLLFGELFIFEGLFPDSYFGFVCNRCRVFWGR